MRRPGATIATILALTLAAAFPPPGSAQEPQYQGKKASEWLDIAANDASARKRALAAEALARLWREQQHLPSLNGLVRTLRVDASPAVRLQCARLLQGLPERDIKGLARELAEALAAEKDARVRRELAVLIGRYPAVARLGVTGLIRALEDTEAATRIAAAEALAAAGEEAKSAAPQLVAMLQNADAGVRRAAVIALGRIRPEGAPAIAEQLAAMLHQTDDVELRRELLVALGLLQEKSSAVVAALVRMLDDKDDELRQRAVRILGSFGPDAAAAADPLLRAATKDPQRAIRVDAVHGFAAVLGDTFKARWRELLPLLQDAEHLVRLAVVEEIGALGPALQGDGEVLRLLRQRLSDPHVKVREAVAAVIKRIEQKPEPKKEPR